MDLRRTLAVAACLMVSLVAAPSALAEPEPAPPPVPAGAPLPNTVAVGSAAPVSTVTPDGWTIAVAARDETQQTVAPLTTAVSSREYIVGGTFTGSVSGTGTTQVTGGILEAGYQIGCGIDMGTSNGVRLSGEAGLVPEPIVELGPTGVPTGYEARLSVPVGGGVAVYLKPGIINNVQVSKKDFHGANPRITITGFHIKIDGCVGQSFIRSYATLTISTGETDDVIAYMGVTKVV